MPVKSTYRKLQQALLNSPTVSLLGEGPYDRAPYDQREGRDDHNCTGFS
jgi:hypothetical protein